MTENSSTIRIRGARENNLKNVSIEIPKNQLVVFTGVSGSGKSSLAFDTIYAEGQRRYVESLSSYARQFLGIMDKPDVDGIEGLSPAISIDQKSTSHNPRSTVGTITEIYDYLRLLFARIGHPHCPNCGREIMRQSPQQIVENIIESLKKSVSTGGKKPIRFITFSPIIRDRKGEFTQTFDSLRAKGYTTVRIDSEMYSLSEDLVLIKTNKHSIDVVTDRFTVDRETLKDEKRKSFTTRLTEAIEQSLALSEGLVVISRVDDVSFTFPEKPKKLHDTLCSIKFSCPVCNISLPEIEPRIFSFNSPHGACPTCAGIGSLLRVNPDLVLNPNLTIHEGAILPFARLILTDTWFGRIILHVAKTLGIRLDVPLREVPKDILNKLLYGTGNTEYAVSGDNRFGREVTIYETYPGIVSELEKRFSKTESEYVRHEISKYMRSQLCPVCAGKRLKIEALAVTIDHKSIVDVTHLSIKRASEWIEEVQKTFSVREKTIALLVIREIYGRLQFLISVGLEYLTLDRGATSLSGGEAQRIRLASQIGSGLSGVLYVLDEPSIGLHARDNKKLITTLKHLRDLGNSVIVVEHDREMMEEADFIVDFGPGAGEHGGKVIAEGSYSEIVKNSASLTGKYLSGKKTIRLEKKIDSIVPSINHPMKELKLIEACENNLKSITVVFPLHSFVCVSGVSGSGKSTLVIDTLYQALASYFNPYYKEKIGKHKTLEGIENIRRVILIDQSPIGRTPRSNPATYTGAFTFIRELLAQTPEAKVRGFAPGRFSFNVRGGRCEACEGEGVTKIEMQFLPDVYVTCEVCNGSRFNCETLEVRFKGKNVSEILDMTVEQAHEFFKNIPGLFSKLITLHEVGLSYIHLGQPAPQLSGGEAQRVKLATELSKKSTRDTLFILDEPTTGLHFADLEKLLHVLRSLVDMGNTVIVIEHNLDILKNADFIIDLGPEGGDAGGKVIATGTPEDLSKNSSSFTGNVLKNVVGKKI